MSAAIMGELDEGCFVCSWCIFFFKQKTAYEMRISDWSSDVCSSDLGAMAGRQGIAAPGRRVAQQGDGQQRIGGRLLAPDQQQQRHQHQRAERSESVVSGKSESVRVDSGGRRLININTYIAT